MWFILSLFFALWSSVNVILVKKLAGKLSIRVLLTFNFIFSIPFYLIIIFFTGGFPKAATNFYLLVSTSSLIDFLAFNASTTAIKISPISLISPISSFTPIFTSIIAVLTLKEVPSFLHLLGIAIIVLGAYILNLSDFNKGFLKPFKDLFSNKGVQLALLSTFLWSITPIFQKQAILSTNPASAIVAAFAGTIGNAILFLLFSVDKVKKEFKIVLENIKIFLIMGLFGALGSFAAFIAFQQAQVGLVTSVFKLSILFSIILGAIFFKEQKIKERFIAGLIMLTGVVIITTFL